jgi:hypothetical protein
MVAEPFRKRWTGDEPVGFNSSALRHKPGCSRESNQPPKLAHSVRITAPVPDRVIEGKARRRSPLSAVKKQRARRTGSHRIANAARVRNGATGFDSQALCQV